MTELTKELQENNRIKELILTALADKEMTVTEIHKCKGLENFSKQKLSVLLHQLTEEKTVIRSIVPKWKLFRI